MMARRLRRRSFGPVSSMKTMRVSKKPFSPVMRVKIASEMICATRRELLGSVTYCWPATCWPVATSQAEFRLEPAVAGTLTAAGDDELRVDHAPGIHLRRL